MYWVDDIKLAQRKGVKFYQTRSNAIILNDTFLVYCIPKAIMMGSGEVIYEKSTCVTSTSSKDFLQRQLDEKNWVQKLLEVEKTPNEPNQRPKIQMLEQADLLCQSKQSGSSVQEIENVANLTAKAPMKEKGDLFSICVPVSV